MFFLAITIVCLIMDESINHSTLDGPSVIFALFINSSINGNSGLFSNFNINVFHVGKMELCLTNFNFSDTCHRKLLALILYMRLEISKIAF